MRVRRFWRSPARNLVAALLYSASVMALGTGAYVVEGWSPGDAFYMVVLTVFTVGYDEVRPIDTDALRIITIGVIVFGCTGTIFVTGALVQLFTASQIAQLFGDRRMQNEIGHLSGHVLVCGFGRTGQMLARELHAGGMPFVLLERSEQRAAQARDLGYLVMVGDATDEPTLQAIGIERARALATVLPDDAANVFITLSARSLNATLRIIARAETPSTERKLLHAGAETVVMPAYIGAERIAEIILYPRTARLLRGSNTMRELERGLRAFGLEIDVLPVAADSAFVGLTIQEVETRAAGAFFVVALDRGDGTTIRRPDPQTRVEAEDGLVLVGRGRQVRELEDAFAPQPGPEA